MEIPDIVRCIAALLPEQDRVCLALVSRTCYNALPGIFTPFTGYSMFELAATQGSFAQAYWWLSNYGTCWTEDDAQLLLRRLGEKKCKKRWPRLFLAIFSQTIHSMEECIIEGRICASGGDVDNLLTYTKELVYNVRNKSVDWHDRGDMYAMQILQMIINVAANENFAMHHNIAGHFGIEFPDTQL